MIELTTVADDRYVGSGRERDGRHRTVSKTGASGAVDTSSRPISVLLVDDEESWVRTQCRLLERTTDRLHVSTATSFEAARNAVDETDPDCIVCDYQLGDGTGLELLSRVRAENPGLPFILVTGEGDERVASDAIGEQVTDYIPKLQLSQQPTRLATRIESVVDADRTRRALSHERRSKEALLEMVTASTTRSDLGTNICEQLVEDGYACAWIGVLDDDGGVVPISTAGATGYLETAIPPGRRPVDSTEPSFRALDETDPVVCSLPASETTTVEVDDRETTAAAADWETTAVDHGFRSVAAVPIIHDGVCFGTLPVYSESPELDERELALLSVYAETVGYAFRTTTWKQTLLSTTTTTIEFSLKSQRHPLVALAATLPDGATLSSETVIPRNSREVLYVTTVDGADEAEFLAGADATDAIESVDYYRHDESDRIQCGLVADSPAPETRLVDAGVSLARTVADRQRARITARLSDDVSVRACVDVLADCCGEDSVTTLWTTPNLSGDEADPVDQLTQRQRQVLELAVEAGYFERPRHNNTGELADALDISRATFTQHLRAAQRKLFDSGIHR